MLLNHNRVPYFEQVILTDLNQVTQGVFWRFTMSSHLEFENLKYLEILQFIKTSCNLIGWKRNRFIPVFRSPVFCSSLWKVEDNPSCKIGVGWSIVHILEPYFLWGNFNYLWRSKRSTRRKVTFRREPRRRSDTSSQTSVVLKSQDPYNDASIGMRNDHPDVSTNCNLLRTFL